MSLKQLAQVRDITGHMPPRLKPFEEVSELLVTPDRLVLKISCAKIVERRFETRVISRGYILHQWNLVDGRWIKQEPFAVWWSTDELVRTF